MFVIIQSNRWFSEMLFQFFWFNDKADMVDSGTGSIAGFIETAAIVTAIAFFLHPKKTAEGLLKERADELISRINTSLERTHELDSLESSIKAVNAKLNISFSTDFRAAIQRFVDANTQTLLRDVTPLNKLIDHASEGGCGPA